MGSRYRHNKHAHQSKTMPRPSSSFTISQQFRSPLPLLHIPSLLPMPRLCISKSSDPSHHHATSLHRPSHPTKYKVLDYPDDLNSFSTNHIYHPHIHYILQQPHRNAKQPNNQTTKQTDQVALKIHLHKPNHFLRISDLEAMSNPQPSGIMCCKCGRMNYAPINTPNLYIPPAPVCSQCKHVSFSTFFEA